MGLDRAADSARQERRAQALRRFTKVTNGIMDVLSTGCQWDYIPKDLPPKSTVYGYLDLWEYEGVIDRMHHALYVQCREMMDRRQALPPP